MGYSSVALAKSLVKYVKRNLYSRPWAFVYNHGIYELITHYRDSIHNCEYHNFYNRDSVIVTIAQP